jgi:hypothetical protein
VVDTFANRMPIDERPRTVALRLLVRVEQPFGAHLPAQHRGAEYRKITMISHERGT